MQTKMPLQERVELTTLILLIALAFAGTVLSIAALVVQHVC